MRGNRGDRNDRVDTAFNWRVTISGNDVVDVMRENQATFFDKNELVSGFKDVSTYCVVAGDYSSAAIRALTLHSEEKGKATAANE